MRTRLSSNRTPVPVVGTISWQSSLNSHSRERRNQRSVRSRCCYVRFSE